MQHVEKSIASNGPLSIPSLEERTGPLLCYGAALVIGLALAYYLFSWDYLLGFVDTVRPPRGDIAANIIVQRYFFADAWRWPPLNAANLVGPVGTNVGLLDGIPLVALPVKLLAPLLPPAFHVVNLWYGVAWFLQPLAAVWCLRSAGERRLLPALAIAVAAVSMPAWWSRFSHASLCSHFLILLALGTYFRLVARPEARLLWLGAVILEIVALLTHPYLAMMVLALLGSVPLTLFLRGDHRWTRATVGVVAMVLAQLAGLMVLDYVGVTSGQGFGRFKMDLLGPIWPDSSALFPWKLPPLNEWEGYNYLGAGLLIGAAAVVLLRPVELRAAIARHGGLALAAVGLTLLALSQRPTVGSYELFDAGAVPNWLENLRSTGRFFWPVAYTLLLGTIVLAARHPNRRLAALLLVAIGVVQFADAGVLREVVRLQIAKPSAEWKVNAPKLRALLTEAQSVTLLPTWYCMPSPNWAEDQDLMLEVLLLASETAVPASTMATSRWHGVLICNDRRLAGAPLGRGELRILTPMAQTFYLPLVPRADKLCESAGPVLVCHDPAATGRPPTEPADRAPLGLGRVEFSSGAAGLAMLGKGWWDAEIDGSWSVGRRAELRVERPADLKDPLRLRFETIGFSNSDGGTQRVEIWLDGQKLERWTLPDRQVKLMSVEVPAGPPGPLTLEVRITSPARPVDRGLGEDTRLLGVKLRALEVMRAS